MLQSHSPSPSRFPFNTNSNDSKTESIVKNFYIKTAQTIIQSRQQQQQQQNESIDNDDGKKRMNRWFNMNTREYPDSLRSELKYWITRAFVSPITQPPPLIIEIYLDISNIPLGKQLALKNGWKIIDLDFISSSSSSNIIPKKRIILENWILTLNHPLPTQTLDLGNVYKRSILFFRTLYAFTRLLPLYQNTFKERTMSNVTATEDQQFIIDNIGYRLTSSINNKKEDEISLDEGPNSNTTITQDLDSIVTPLGTLGLQVHYRANCDFIIHDPLDINTIGSQQQQPDSSAQLMDLDYNYFTPTIAKYTDNNKTIDSSDDDKKENEIGDTFKTITKAVNKNQTITQWPPIPRKSESARVATTTETTSLSRYHHQRRQTYNNEHRPASSSSSSSSRHTTHNNAHRPRSFSLRPLSINDEDNLFIKSVEPPSISPSSSSRVHHISPFKSPTLSSSSQHSSTFSLRSMRGTGEDDKKSTKSNITRRFSSSFDYRHTDRYYHSAPSEGNNEIQTSSPSSRTRSRRSFSVARRSSIASDQDKELEEFVRSLNLPHTPGFQSRILNEEETENSTFNDTYGPSLDIYASYYRSKKALTHFQNLRGVHDSLSQSLVSSSTILSSPPLEQQSSTIESMKENQPSRTAPHGDLDTSSNSSLLSLSLSRGSPLSRLSYQPRAPSPLHTEPPVSPIHGATPVRIPSTRTTTATTTRTVQRHDTSNNNNPALSADDGDSYNSTCSSNEYSNSDNNPYPPFMQSSFQRTGNTHNELSHKRRSSIIGNNHTSEQQQQRNAFLKYNEIRRTAQLSINTESPSSSSGGLDKDDDADENGQPVSPIVHDEDDDSLVFKMSELGLYEHK